jgi:2-oxoglutarate dehydrogenase E1 component
MATETGTFEVVMPAMGDSVAEGTILEWHKQEGDAIEADETLVEISTDKVDAEVPSPVSGTVVKIHAAEGDTVAVGGLLAEIDTNGGGGPAASPALGQESGTTPAEAAETEAQHHDAGERPSRRRPAAR